MGRKTGKTGGKVELFQDQIMRKFGGGKVKGYQGGGTVVRRSPQMDAHRRGPVKAAGRPYLATNTAEPFNVRQRPGGMKKGGKT